jgi:predicted amidohydrolase
MQDLKIALVQADQHWEDKTANLLNYRAMVAEIENIDVILFPEMFHTGFSMNAGSLAESMDESEGINWLLDLAAEKDCAVYTSMIIIENGLFYNRGLFIEPNGTINIYDKRKTFGLAGEDKIYTSGTEETIVSYKGWNFQLQICYDLRFPEIVRNRIKPNGLVAYDVILYVANWPEKRIGHWKALLKSRAIENQCYVLGVNRVGLDGSQLTYSGDSSCIDALGNERIAKENKEEILIITLDKKELDEIRTNLPFLKDC